MVIRAASLSVCPDFCSSYGSVVLPPVGDGERSGSKANTFAVPASRETPALFAIVCNSGATLARMRLKPTRAT